MALSPGSRLGPYEIVAPIGAGGMGEVYKAQDTRLERTVAVKVLPAHLSASPESRQRFEREAKTISQLSHPHICALYDVGSEGETEYLVMEYLEGETLADRLGKGALPLEQTLRYGGEIADALDKAHRQGIVHRDLKPGNVMLTKSGVKLLDFGLAKAIAPVAPQSGLTALPTMAGSPNLTQAGTILGTFQYMAPEQLEGKEADGRTDIFALGAVLYEMATGRKAFVGTSQASLISSIMKEEPTPISTLAPMSPAALDRVVRTCLAKDPEDRWQSAHDVGGELKWIAEGSQAGVPAKVATRRRSRERFAWALAGVTTVLAALLAAGYLRRSPPPTALIRAALVLPEKTYLGDLALSPDGRRVAFTVGKLGGLPGLWIRDLGAETSVPVPGADEEVRFPFWSPDGRFVAFFAQGKLRRVEPPGGAVQTICDASDGSGGTWGRDGTIVFAPSPTSPLFRVAASGGAPAPITRLDAGRHEVAHRYPSFLPDGRRFLYFAADLSDSKGEPYRGIRVGSIDGKVDKAVVAVSSNAQFAGGRILYVRDRALLAQRFDLDRLKAEGDPVVLAPLVDRTNGYLASFAFTAAENALVLAPAFLPPSQLRWFDRSGKAMGVVGEPGALGVHRLSPDGRSVAVARINPGRGTSEIWVYDVASGTGTKFAFAPPGIYDNPVWSRDGTRIFFSSSASAGSGRSELWVKALDGSSGQRYVVSSSQQVPQDWSADGRFLSIMNILPQGKRNPEIWVLKADDPQHPVPFEAESVYQGNSRFSPDGKWIAYDSLESGTIETYVRPYPGPGQKWKISTAGGGGPQWRADGKEIYYESLDDKLMAVPVSLEPTFHAGTPSAAFSTGSAFGSVFDATGNGQRFLVNAASQADMGSPPLNLLVNWTALLKNNETAR